jgi:phospho-N-acetylmuramoyl-pentapeptide-transferase
VLAAAVAFVVTFGLGSAFIVFLQSRKFGQFVREEGPQTHLIKAGTPTMGGVVMLTGLVAALLVVARANAATFATLLLVAVVAGIGLYDDWQKISKKRPEGLSARYKFGLLTLAVVLADVLSVYYVGVTQTVLVPYFDLSLVLGPGIVGLALFSGFLLLVIVGTTNAVNLTDGLDGLAAGLFVVEALSVMIQVAVFKLTGKRVFKMAPIHHHFEFLGWEENKVVVRFWIVQAAFSAFGFFLYYLFLYNAVG